MIDKMLRDARFVQTRKVVPRAKQHFLLTHTSTRQLRYVRHLFGTGKETAHSHERLPRLVLDLLPPSLIRPQQLLPLALPTHPARADDRPQDDDPRDPFDFVSFPYRIACHHF